MNQQLDDYCLIGRNISIRKYISKSSPAPLRFYEDEGNRANFQLPQPLIAQKQELIHLLQGEAKRNSKKKPIPLKRLKSIFPICFHITKHKHKQKPKRIFTKTNKGYTKHKLKRQ